MLANLALAWLWALCPPLWALWAPWWPDELPC